MTEQHRCATEKGEAERDAEGRLTPPPCDADLTVLGLVDSFLSYQHNSEPLLQPCSQMKHG